MYKGSILLGLENTLNHAFRIGSHLLLYKKEYRYQELMERIENVQSEDIRKLAENIFLSNKINLVIFYPNERKINKNSLIKNLEI